MEVKFAGTPSLKDHYRVCWLQIRPRRAFLIVGIVLLIAFLTFTVAVWFVPAGLHPWEVTLCMSVLIFLVVYTLFEVRRMWRNSPACHEPVSGLATDDSIEQNQPSARICRKWQAYIRYKFSNRLVLLYLAPNLVDMFPRSFFETDADWDRFREMVRKKVPAR